MKTAYEMSYRMGILAGRTAKRFIADGKDPGVGVAFKDHGDLLSAVDPYAEGYRAGLNDTAPAVYSAGCTGCKWAIQCAAAIGCQHYERG